MATFIIVIVVLFLLIMLGGQRNRNKITKTNTLKIMTNTGNFNIDRSVVDVSGIGFKINAAENGVTSYPSGVPHWGHRYVYSYDEIKYATAEQAAFYRAFKDSFNNGEYLELEGNTNYVFILLFDLLNEFDNHNDLGLAEEQMKTLVIHYPRTKAYAIPFLIKRLEQKGQWNESVELRGRHIHSGYGGYEFEGNYWGLGARYKAKLKLDEADTKVLDTLYYSSNNFFEVEFCALEILKLFVRTIKKLRGIYEGEGASLEKEFGELDDIILRKHYRYHTNSWNYKNGVDTARNDIYLMLLKYCENIVRDHYGHKRKLNIEFSNAPEVKLQLNTKIFSKIELFKQELIQSIAVLDKQTDIELYAQNTARWKILFEQMTEQFSASDGKEFTEQIFALGELNKRNPSVENIFYEASKFIAKKDKAAALNLYVRYLYHDLKSTTFDNKPLTKTIQKSLFTTQEQIRDFEKVIADLINTKDLEKALAALSGFYTIKRKKIQLDKASIAEVHVKHAGTVNLLNEYLGDEYEDANNSVSMRSNGADEVVIDIKPKACLIIRSPYITELSLTDAHIETLEHFSKAGFALSAGELDAFARQRGQFRSSLIDGINEACYEYLDDILIEEDNEEFVINESYYQRILAT